MVFGKDEHTDFNVLKPLDKYSPKVSVSHFSESCSPAHGEGNGTHRLHGDCSVTAFLKQGNSMESPGKRCEDPNPSMLSSIQQLSTHMPFAL